MREIKFRGKKINDNTMLFGDLNFIDGKVYVFPRDKEAPYNSPDWFEVDPETIGQMVGVNDKNGEPIYEGDIVKWISVHNDSPKEHIDTVTWIDEQACFLLMPFVHEPYAAIMEIIGNIYENPELVTPK